MPCVDYWLLADNSETPRIIVAEGGRGMEMCIRDSEIGITLWIGELDSEGINGGNDAVEKQGG